jgi:hypothetical protein
VSMAEANAIENFKPAGNGCRWMERASATPTSAVASAPRWRVDSLPYSRQLE